MKIHEYQAKQILKAHKVAVLDGHVATSVDEAVAGAEALPGPVYVVKSQVHAGGRGKGRFKNVASEADLAAVLAGAEEVPGKGGVRVCFSIDDVRAETRIGDRVQPIPGVFLETAAKQPHE